MRQENWKVFLWCSYKPWMCNEQWTPGTFVDLSGICWWHLWYSKEKVEICWCFWFKYKCRITQRITHQTLLLVGSGLGMNTTEKWKAISVSGTIHKIFYSTVITVFNPNKKNNLKQFFLKLKLHIFLLEVCLKMKNQQRKNTTGLVSNVVYADGLCQHCFDFRNYFCF